MNFHKWSLPHIVGSLRINLNCSDTSTITSFLFFQEHSDSNIICFNYSSNKITFHSHIEMFKLVTSDQTNRILDQILNIRGMTTIIIMTAECVWGHPGNGIWNKLLMFCIKWMETITIQCNTILYHTKQDNMISYNTVWSDTMWYPWYMWHLVIKQTLLYRETYRGEKDIQDSSWT